jgi:hypothetical protein
MKVESEAEAVNTFKPTVDHWKSKQMLRRERKKEVIVAVRRLIL